MAGGESSLAPPLAGACYRPNPHALTLAPALALALTLTLTLTLTLARTLTLALTLVLALVLALALALALTLALALSRSVLQTVLWVDEVGVACDLSSLVHAQVHELHLKLHLSCT